MISMPASVQQPLPPMPLEAVEKFSELQRNKVAGDLSLSDAQALAGDLVAAVLRETDAGQKELGNKSQVSRWAKGQENPNLARLIQKADGRKAMLKALARSLPGVEIETSIRISEVG